MRRCGVEGSGGVGSRRRSLSSFAERGLEEQRGPGGGQGVDRECRWRDGRLHCACGRWAHTSPGTGETVATKVVFLRMRLVYCTRDLQMPGSPLLRTAFVLSADIPRFMTGDASSVVPRCAPLPRSRAGGAFPEWRATAWR